MSEIELKGSCLCGDVEYMIKADTTEHAPDVKPEARIFWDSRAEWSCIDNLPAFAEYPE